MRPEGRLRLFFAASLPVELLERVEGAGRSLRERWPNARWAPVANQHVTLKFLGSVEEGLLEQLREVAAIVASGAEPAKLSLGGLGVFPSRTRARVLWVGLDDPAGLLASLSAGLDRGLEGLGFQSETRPFRAHLTLARFRTPVRAADLPEIELGDTSFPVASFELFRSHLHPKGARYEIVSSYPLGRND